MTKRHFDYYNRKNPEKGYLNYDEFMRFSREREPFLKLTDKDFEGPPPEVYTNQSRLAFCFVRSAFQTLFTDTDRCCFAGPHETSWIPQQKRDEDGDRRD